MVEQIQAAQQYLRQTQLNDGSWPYYLTSDQGSPEPTCLAALALAGVDEDTAVTSALNWLTNLVDKNGAVILPGDDEPHWSTAHLAITLTHLKHDEPLRDQTITWLLDWHGNEPGNSQESNAKADPYGAIILDPTLIGWSWISNTFSWVEPTCYGLLALKKAGIRHHERITQAEAMLLDRVCVGGGWNVGNPIVWGQAIEAALPQTALALLALQDKPADTITEQGLALLLDETNKAYSTLSLALTILCLQAYKLPASVFVDRLLQRQLPDGSWRQMTQLTALAVLALQSVGGGSNVYQL
ncbi:MAG: terpene cyclase/mutase family protein [Ardenticatenaceae bacterium]|nr:terpene cyclase/mutase family protein [Ardenticatenaceae bacterium]MCB9445805.1 terpene cyclase/mutase family protein [Ardenticatenaceae bacterium]